MIKTRKTNGLRTETISRENQDMGNIDDIAVKKKRNMTVIAKAKLRWEMIQDGEDVMKRNLTVNVDIQGLQIGVGVLRNDREEDVGTIKISMIQLKLVIVTNLGMSKPLQLYKNHAPYWIVEMSPTQTVTLKTTKLKEESEVTTNVGTQSA